MRGHIYMLLFTTVSLLSRISSIVLVSRTVTNLQIYHYRFFDCHAAIFAGVHVTVMQLNGPDLAGLLSLYCQPCTKSTQVLCPVAAVTLNQ